MESRLHEKTSRMFLGREVHPSCPISYCTPRNLPRCFGSCKIMEDTRITDRLVASIMGWQWNESSATSPSGSRNCRVQSSGPWWWLPHYSSEMGAAWQVIDRLEDLFDISLWSPRDRSDDEASNKWECEMSCKTTRSLWQAYGDSAPEAICAVAIKVFSSGKL